MDIHHFDNARLLHALQIAAACVVTVIISVLSHLSNAFLAVVTTFVLLTIFSEEVAPMALERFLGPAFGAILALLFISIFYDLHGFYLLLLFLFVTAFMYLFAAKVLPYAALMGGITFAFVMFTAMQSPSDAVHIGIDWVRGIVVGGIVAWLFSYYVICEKKTISLISAVGLSAKFAALLPLQSNILKQALKVAIAIFFVLWTNVYLNWPGGVQALIACTVIVAQPNLGRSHQRLYLRLLGIIAGGAFSALGIIILLHLPYFFTLVILFLFGFWVAAYAVLGDPQYAYAGVMAGVILPMTLFVSQGPLGTLAIVIDRFAGVFVGAAVGLCVLYFIWPVFPEQQMRAKLAAVLRDCAILYQNILQPNKENLLHVRQNILQQLQEKLELIEDTKYLVYGKKSHTKNFAPVSRAVALLVVKLEILVGLTQYSSLVTMEDYLLIVKTFEELLLEMEKLISFTEEL